MKPERNMLTIIIITALGGIAIGTLAGVKIAKKEPVSQPVSPIVISDAVAKDQQEVIKQLTDLDLLTTPCSAEYIEHNDDLLCREMFCLMNTRGIDSQTAGSQCEEISNISNSKTMINHCEQFLENKTECYEKYRQRK